MRSLHDSRSAPYTVERDGVRGWTVVLNPPSSPTVVLALRPALEMVSDLHNQVFLRAMESLVIPAEAGLPLVMRSEFTESLAGRTTLGALAAAARDAGLETATLTPRCLGYRRVSEPRSTRQVYFALFDIPEFSRFREELAGIPGSAAAGFDPAGLSPVLIIAASDEVVGRWLPLRLQPDTDCVAPIVIR